MTTMSEHHLDLLLDKAERERQKEIEAKTLEYCRTPDRIQSYLLDYPEQLAPFVSALMGEDYADAALELREVIQRYARDDAKNDVPEVDETMLGFVERDEC